MDGYLCECVNCGMGETRSLVNPDEYRILSSNSEYYKSYVYIVIKNHKSNEDIVLSETDTLYLVREPSLEDLVELISEYLEKISSLDTDQKIGNRE